MNATEHLVELYYRQRNNLTFTDFKVEGGNNRQFDVLAYHKPTDKLRHIEVSVTHWMSKINYDACEIYFKQGTLISIKVGLYTSPHLKDFRAI